MNTYNVSFYPIGKAIAIKNRYVEAWSEAEAEAAARSEFNVGVDDESLKVGVQLLKLSDVPQPEPEPEPETQAKPAAAKTAKTAEKAPLEVKAATDAAATVADKTA